MLVLAGVQCSVLGSHIAYRQSPFGYKTQSWVSNALDTNGRFFFFLLTSVLQFLYFRFRTSVCSTCPKYSCNLWHMDMKICQDGLVPKLCLTWLVCSYKAVDLWLLYLKTYLCGCFGPKMSYGVISEPGVCHFKKLGLREGACPLAAAWNTVIYVFFYICRQLWVADWKQKLKSTPSRS